jgi:hypothetical protein
VYPREMAKNNNYKLILFDKECDGLNLSEFASIVNTTNEISGLKTYLVLINDTSMSLDPNDSTYVDETIKNVVNKDLLRLVFEKFI